MNKIFKLSDTTVAHPIIERQTDCLSPLGADAVGNKLLNNFSLEHTHTCSFDMLCDWAPEVLKFLDVRDHLAMFAISHLVRQGMERAYQNCSFHIFEETVLSCKEDFHSLRWVLRKGMRISRPLRFIIAQDDGRMVTDDAEVFRCLISARDKKIADAFVLSNKPRDFLDTSDQFGSTLCLAASRGYLACVNHLIRAGADLNYCDSSTRKCPLSWSVDRGHIEIVEVLLAAGATIHHVDEAGKTPFSWAAEHGNIKCMKRLLDEGAELDHVDDQGFTPLLRAANERCFQVVIFLLANGAEANYQNPNDGESALHYAASYGHHESVEYLLAAGANVNLPDGVGNSAFHQASKNGYAYIMRKLLDAGADLYAPDHGGRSPLLEAIEGNYMDSIGLILEAAAKEGDERVRMLVNSVGDPNDGNGESLLYKAAARKNLPAVKALLGAGADIASITIASETPLNRAARDGSQNITSVLLEAAARSTTTSLSTYVNMPCVQSFTPLRWAARRGYLQIVHLLLAAGANVDQIDSRKKQSPLFLAAEKGQSDVVEVLLAAGADPYLVDEYKRSPLHRASAGGHCNVVCVLLSWEHDRDYATTLKNKLVHLVDNRNCSALHYAAECDHVDLLRLLLLKMDEIGGRKETIDAIMAVDRNGKTCLHKAVSVAKHGHSWTSKVHTECVSVIIDFMLKIPSDMEEQKLYSIFKSFEMMKDAVKSGNLMLVKALRPAAVLLIPPETKGELWVDKLDDSGHTLLSYAARQGSKEMVQYLLSLCADPNKAGDLPCARTPLSRAAAKGHLEVCTLLLEAGATTEISSKHDGRTPLMHASVHGHCEVVHLLSQAAGADINRQDNKGMTCIHLAAKYNHLGTTKVLRDAGANTNAQNASGKTPIDLVLDNESRSNGMEIILILRGPRLLPSLLSLESKSSHREEEKSEKNVGDRRDAVEMKLERGWREIEERFGNRPVWKDAKTKNNNVKM